MEEKQGKGNTVLLTVLGIATLLVAVIGATFAYFSASSVSGNSATNNITATTATYGNTTVSFDGTYGTLDTGLIDLPYLGEGVTQDYSWLLKFKVTTTATAPQDITVSWKNVENTFCQYQVGTGTVCSQYAGKCMNGGNDITSTYSNKEACLANSGTWTDNTFRGDELYYDLYYCNETAWNSASANTTEHTVTIDNENCSLISSALDHKAPVSETSDILHATSELRLAATGTNYYALVLSMKNLSTTQDYNQGKRFSGTVNVAIVQQTQ